MGNEKWWKEIVVYQIYPRSFQDSNGDGIGDLKGIFSRLDYLKDLGIGAIWLSPVCKSPQDDNGYDISDYQDIDPMFGSLEDMELLIQEAGKRDIRIIMDLVLNHSSDEHPWFKEARKSKDNPYHDYYVWRDGVEGTPPNDLGSTFGGSAWEWVPELGQYYLHLFSVKQPDLNWENPKVRQEIYDMIQWWMDKGVGGFRLDVIDLIGKEPDLKITGNGPNLRKYMRELSKETFQKGDLLTVGETWGATPESAKLYSNPDGSELSMVFQFEHISLDEQQGKGKWDLQPLDLLQLKKVLSKWQTELKGEAWNSLFWNNHDLPRIVSRWGNDGEYRVESAKMLATLLHGMQGTPYVYQGEELGMTNVRYDIEEYRDIELLNLYKERIGQGYSKEDVMESIYAKGRDNARTPMQWDTSENAGFTEGKPWILVNPNYTEINAEESMNNPNSIYQYYKTLIQLRKEHEVIIYGDYELLYPEDTNLFAYTRTLGGTKLLVLCNFYGKIVPFQIPREFAGDKRLLISNYSDGVSENALRPYEARMYLLG
ncbi:glycoside hydrolase family 13 protein [Paenibacillus xylanivorans]|uniref:Glucan 1,6-alpha-glucosidase n=1 Tax=Paenibacillus xylanivorans TaxID=1705561 RepID=A0A0N0C3V3_9BACL|nr:alpha-glucosidase [Paenibacillus xylanivorans]KOY14874.1 glucan 1,6-alpha-glucosidase [Paenibacillus xylanivorans]